MTTSLTHFSTIPAVLGFGSSSNKDQAFADARPDDEVWQLMRWPSRKPTFAELHWLAGLFEGEGSFSGGAVVIPQHDREILDQVRRLVGGRVGGPYTKLDRRTGRTYACFVWYAHGPRGRGIARALFHLLSTRRQAQARMFLRIPRDQVPPKLDASDPTRLLWDWAPEEALDEFE